MLKDFWAEDRNRYELVLSKYVEGEQTIPVTGPLNDEYVKCSAIENYNYIALILSSFKLGHSSKLS